MTTMTTTIENEHVDDGKNDKNDWVVVSSIVFHPYLGNMSNLTNIFHLGWNHQLDDDDTNKNNHDQ